MADISDDKDPFVRSVRIAVSAIAAIVGLTGGIVGLLGLKVGNGWLTTQVPAVSLLLVTTVAFVILVTASTFVWVASRRSAASVRTATTKALALESTLLRLEELQRLDPMTGIPNVVALEQQLDRRANFKRPGPATLVLIDLENFRSINKQVGHWVGDEILRQFAIGLYSSNRRDEHVYRRTAAADEFYILLNSSVIQSLGYLNRLHAQMPEFSQIAAKLGATYEFRFRAVITPLTTADTLSTVTKDLGHRFERVSSASRRALVDWATRADDELTPRSFDDDAGGLSAADRAIFDQARKNFAVPGEGEIRKRDLGGR